MYNDEQLQNSQDSNIEKTWSKKFTHKWTNISKSLKLYKLLIDSLHITGGFFLYRITLVMGSRKWKAERIPEMKKTTMMEEITEKIVKS